MLPQISGESSESDDSTSGSIDFARNHNPRSVERTGDAEDRVVSAGEVALSDLRAGSTADEKEEDEDSEDEVEVMEAPRDLLNYHAQAGLYTDQLVAVLIRLIHMLSLYFLVCITTQYYHKNTPTQMHFH